MSVAPGVDGPVLPVVGGVLGSVGSGKTGRGVGDVVGVGGVELGSDNGGRGATTLSCCELLTITSAITRPITARTAITASIHSQRGEFGPSGGGCGGSPGGYCGPYWPVAYGGTYGAW